MWVVELQVENQICESFWTRFVARDITFQDFVAKLMLSYSLLWFDGICPRQVLPPGESSAHPLSWRERVSNDPPPPWLAKPSEFLTTRFRLLAPERREHTSPAKPLLHAIAVPSLRKGPSPRQTATLDSGRLVSLCLRPRPPRGRARLTWGARGPSRVQCRLKFYLPTW